MCSALIVTYLFELHPTYTLHNSYYCIKRISLAYMVTNFEFCSLTIVMEHLFLYSISLLYSLVYCFPYALTFCSLFIYLWVQLSYQIVDSMIWLGIRDMINEFRKRKLKLRPVTYLSGSQGTSSDIPHGYIWSPNLVPKPKGQALTICNAYVINDNFYPCICIGIISNHKHYSTK